MVLPSGGYCRDRNTTAKIRHFLSHFLAVACFFPKLARNFNGVIREPMTIYSKRSFMRTITTSNNLTIKAMDMITNKLKNIVVMCKIFFKNFGSVSVRFLKKKTWIRFGMSLFRFCFKKCGSVPIL